MSRTNSGPPNYIICSPRRVWRSPESQQGPKVTPESVWVERKQTTWGKSILGQRPNIPKNTWFSLKIFKAYMSKLTPFRGRIPSPQSQWRKEGPQSVGKRVSVGAGEGGYRRRIQRGNKELPAQYWWWDRSVPEGCSSTGSEWLDLLRWALLWFILIL